MIKSMTREEIYNLIIKYRDNSLFDYKEELYISHIEFLDDLCTLQDDTGFFSLDNIDTRIELPYQRYVLEPTYIILKILLESKDNKYHDIILKTLTAVKKTKFYINALEFLRYRTLTMLLDVGIKEYCDQELNELIDYIVVTARKRLYYRDVYTGIYSIEYDIKNLLSIVDHDCYFFYGMLERESIQKLMNFDVKFIGLVKESEIESIHGLLSMKPSINKQVSGIVCTLSSQQKEVIDHLEGQEYRCKRIEVIYENKIYYPFVYIHKDYSCNY